MGHHGPMGGHGHGGGRMGGSGVVPFRAGDWKCGNEVCGYHNFAKNVCCLRCGASRAGAAVVADSGYPSPMDGGSNYPMSQNSMGSGHGHGPLHLPPGASRPAHLRSSFGHRRGATSYPSLNTHFGPSPGSHSAGPFDSRAAEAAFQSATNGPASAGPSNNFYNQNENDPFSFLSSGMGGLSVSNNEGRQNGGAAPSKPFAKV
ncbi:unnamed protein product [Parascedosporium putredinis]|uniref:RanBP2-type domain-containing protein n=1 Tax=Parascedosporium putredinis TaxID=1442378 RepID=A0A9P1H1Y6_9PEZI|nr:unnamed protein product [Parascedosporium putredinis]CAI7993184.1 unnamed protein product [Parascedosporium putredinis]